VHTYNACCSLGYSLENIVSILIYNKFNMAVSIGWRCQLELATKLGTYSPRIIAKAKWATYNAYYTYGYLQFHMQMCNIFVGVIGFWLQLSNPLCFLLHTFLLLSFFFAGVRILRTRRCVNARKYATKKKSKQNEWKYVHKNTLKWFYGAI